MTKREPTESRQRQIADAALKIIAEQGVSRFTTAAIAHAVGITEGAIFRHFDSKEAIVLAAIDRIEELFETDAPLEVADPLERLRRFVEHRVSIVREYGGIPRLVFSDELSLAAGEAGSQKVQAIRKRALTFIQKCLSDAIAAGGLPSSLDVEATALVVQGTIMAMVHGRSPRVSVERVWEVLRAALGGRVSKRAAR